MNQSTPLLARALPLRLSVLLLLTSALVLLGISPKVSPIPQVVVNGDITTDTTWTPANGPYLVSTLVTVTEQATLTIEPGVEVRFAANAGLRVQGGLNVRAKPAQQVRLVGEAGQRWAGIQIVQPRAQVLLRSVTLSDAAVGIAIQQTGSAPSAQSKVTIVNSLITANGTGILADYTLVDGAPKLHVRSNLITKNAIGMLVTNVSNKNKLKLNHNSFVENGIGLQVVGTTKFKAKRQWWGSADGPITGTCTSLPVPRSDPRDRVCGASVEYQPWAQVPAGRVRLPAGAGITLESDLGAGIVAENEDAPTSIITLTVPTGAFTREVDLTVSGLTQEETPAAQSGQGTQLAFEITAVASDADIHTFAGGKELQIDIQYEANDVTGVDPASLGVVFYNEATGTWSRQGVRSTIDPANRRISAELEHLTRFSVRSITGYSDVWMPFVTR